jgi:hypothetical protein
MNTDNLAISAETEVSLDRICVLLPGEPKGSEGVFRRVV